MNRWLFRVAAQEVNQAGANIGPATTSTAAFLYVPQDLPWDNGATDSGIAGHTSPAANPGGIQVFRIVTQPTGVGAWRAVLRVLSGTAKLSIRRDYPALDAHELTPAPSSNPASIGRALPDNGIETWFLTVDASPGAIWTVFAGEAFVQDLGAVGAGAAPAGQTANVGAEGYRFFKATLPVGTAGWQLWLNNGAGAMSGVTNSALTVRRGRIPLVEYGAYDHQQRDHMLLVPPYTDAASDTYFVAVPGTPGAPIHLDSRAVPVQDLAEPTTSCSSRRKNFATGMARWMN
jgi:hypothetical protein